MYNLFNIINSNIEIEYANESVTIDAMKAYYSLKMVVSDFNKRYKINKINQTSVEDIDVMINELKDMNKYLSNLLVEVKATHGNILDTVLSKLIAWFPSIIIMTTKVVYNTLSSKNVVELNKDTMTREEILSHIDSSMNRYNRDKKVNKGLSTAFVLASANTVRNTKTNKTIVSKKEKGIRNNNTMVNKLKAQIYQTRDNNNKLIKLLEKDKERMLENE